MSGERHGAEGGPKNRREARRERIKMRRAMREVVKRRSKIQQGELKARVEAQKDKVNKSPYLDEKQKLKVDAGQFNTMVNSLENKNLRRAVLVEFAAVVEALNQCEASGVKLSAEETDFSNQFDRRLSELGGNVTPKDLYDYFQKKMAEAAQKGNSDGELLRELRTAKRNLRRMMRKHMHAPEHTHANRNRGQHGHYGEEDRVKDEAPAPAPAAPAAAPAPKAEGEKPTPNPTLTPPSGGGGRSSSGGGGDVPPYIPASSMPSYQVVHGFEHKAHTVFSELDGKSEAALDAQKEAAITILDDYTELANEKAVLEAQMAEVKAKIDVAADTVKAPLFQEIAAAEVRMSALKTQLKEKNNELLVAIAKFPKSEPSVEVAVLDYKKTLSDSGTTPEEKSEKEDIAKLAILAASESKILVDKEKTSKSDSVSDQDPIPAPEKATAVTEAQEAYTMAALLRLPNGPLTSQGQLTDQMKESLTAELKALYETDGVSVILAPIYELETYEEQQVAIEKTLGLLLEGLEPEKQAILLGEMTNLLLQSEEESAEALMAQFDTFIGSLDKREEKDRILYWEFVRDSFKGELNNSYDALKRLNDIDAKKLNEEEKETHKNYVEAHRRELQVAKAMDIAILGLSTLQASFDFTDKDYLNLKKGQTTLERGTFTVDEDYEVAYCAEKGFNLILEKIQNNYMQDLASGEIGLDENPFTHYFDQLKEDEMSSEEKDLFQEYLDGDENLGEDSWTNLWGGDTESIFENEFYGDGFEDTTDKVFENPLEGYEHLQIKKIEHLRSMGRYAEARLLCGEILALETNADDEEAIYDKLVAEKEASVRAQIKEDMKAQGMKDINLGQLTALTEQSLRGEAHVRALIKVGKSQLDSGKGEEYTGYQKEVFDLFVDINGNTSWKNGELHWDDRTGDMAIEISKMVVEIAVIEAATGGVGGLAVSGLRAAAGTARVARIANSTVGIVGRTALRAEGLVLPAATASRGSRVGGFMIRNGLHAAAFTGGTMVMNGDMPDTVGEAASQFGVNFVTLGALKGFQNFMRVPANDALFVSTTGNIRNDVFGGGLNMMSRVDNAQTHLVSFLNNRNPILRTAIEIGGETGTLLATSHAVEQVQRLAMTEDEALARQTDFKEDALHTLATVLALRVGGFAGKKISPAPAPASAPAPAPASAGALTP